MSVWSERSTGKEGPVSLRGPLCRFTSSAATLCLEYANAERSVQKCLWAKVKSNQKGRASSCRALFPRLRSHSTGRQSTCRHRSLSSEEQKCSRLPWGRRECSRAPVFSPSRALKFLLEELLQGDRAWKATRSAYVQYPDSTGTEPRSTAITDTWRTKICTKKCL